MRNASDDVDPIHLHRHAQPVQSPVGFILTFRRVFPLEGNRNDGYHRPNVCAAFQSHEDGSDGIPSIKTFKGPL
jgi:hypothetical protein